MSLKRLKELVKRPLYGLYEQRLELASRQWRRPRHLGLILDGNRRFARQQHLGRVTEGHARGADKVHEVITWCFEYGIGTVTIWVFSLDNLRRDPEEVQGLFDLFEEKTRAIARSEQVHQHRIRLRYLGRTDCLPESLRGVIADAEERTKAYEEHTLNVAIAYGGREEILDAVRKYVRAGVAEGRELDEVLDSLEPDSLGPHLYTSGQPDPDLIIRTSGEVRLSGFLLWQSAYSEYYFCDTLWPGFRRIDFLRALRDYHHRQRRYGK